MKKMKKQDFKKLALLGLAGSTALTTQAVAATSSETINPSQILASGGCQGRSGCNRPALNGYQAYRDAPSQGQQQQNQQQQQQQNQQWQSTQSTQPQSGCSSQPQQQPTQTSASCGGQSPSRGQTAYNQNDSNYSQQLWQSTTPAQPQSGCSGRTQMPSQPQYQQQQPTQTSASCGGQSSSRGQTAYNQRPMSPQQQWQSTTPAQPQSGCSGRTQTPNQPQYQPQYQQPQAYAGCGGQSSSKGQTAYNQRPTSSQQQWQQSQPAQMPDSDNDMTQPQGQPQPQPQPNTTGQSPTASNMRGNFTQWEVAETTNKANSMYSTTPVPTAPALTESTLMSQLSPQGKAAYQSLDSAGKALALKMANQPCAHQNGCKGLNSCKTTEHQCAGYGSCAGTAEAPFKDKNLAVKVASMKMAEKRANATSPNY